MAIRFTPIHQQVLVLVRDGRIAWRNRTCPVGGFSHAGGPRVSPGLDLVALYELWNAQLIVVDRQAEQVTVTAAGLNMLQAKRRTLTISSTRRHPEPVRHGAADADIQQAVVAADPV